MSEPRAEAALRALWPGWAGSFVPLRQGPDTWVYRLSGGPVPAVVKVWAEGDEEKSERQALRQAEVAARLAGPYRASGVLWFEAGVMVMEDVCGPDFRRRLETDTAEEVLRDAGHWLAAFHGLTLRRRTFWPKGQVNWLSRISAEVNGGTRTPPRPAGFVKAAQAVASMRAKVRGLPATRAVTHRDLTLSNLVHGPGNNTWGIDFENAKEDEPLRDVFSLALDALCETGETAPLAALRQGYGDEVTAPAVRLFLQRCFALGVWANTPPDPTAHQAQRWTCARQILDSSDPLI
ncbi:aminoglycoside phosphotransferase family protein [Mameliella alba]|nr:aminoglycoside phosphotransferase family protein [Mameliella alba]MBY6170088.1 aminoglycoside phosphotransferase family protein [Mameliella alba]MBY6174935.1 aminoglycoside phosphotransferase family protein [Mameliella alba]